jgi:hypothetical protein
MEHVVNKLKIHTYILRNGRIEVTGRRGRRVGSYWIT